jgi:hypothetical protein
VRLRVNLDFHFSGNCPKPRMTDPAISWREIAITLIGVKSTEAICVRSLDSTPTY